MTEGDITRIIIAAIPYIPTTITALAGLVWALKGRPRRDGRS